MAVLKITVFGLGGGGMYFGGGSVLQSQIIFALSILYSVFQIVAVLLLAIACFVYIKNNWKSKKQE